MVSTHSHNVVTGFEKRAENKLQKIKSPHVRYIVSVQAKKSVSRGHRCGEKTVQIGEVKRIPTVF